MSQVLQKSRLVEFCDSPVKVGITTLTDILFDYYNNYTMRTENAFMILGESGHGKTELGRQLAQRLGGECIWMNITQKTAEDWMGFPYLCKDVQPVATENPMEKIGDMLQSYMTAPARYKFQLPDDIRPIFDPEWKGILIIDEWYQGNRDARRPVFPLLNERRIGGYTISDGAMIILTSNPPTNSDYGLQKPEKADEERMQFFWLETTMNEWYQYSKANGIDDNFLQCIIENPEIFKNSNPRRCTKLMQIMQSIAFDDYLTTDTSRSLRILARLRSIVNSESAIAIQKYMKKIFDISGFAILTDQPRTRKMYTKLFTSSQQIYVFHHIQESTLSVFANPQVLDEYIMTKGMDKVAKNLMDFLLVVHDNHPDLLISLLKGIITTIHESIKVSFFQEFDNLLKKPAYHAVMATYLKCFGYTVDAACCREAAV